MTRRDAVRKALSHQEVFPVPYHAEFTQKALERFTEYTGCPDIEFTKDGFLHYFQYWGWPAELEDRPGWFLDEFGVLWNRSGVDKDIGVIENPLIPDIECSGYRFPACDTLRLRRDIQSMLDTREDRFAIAGFGFVMFERAWSLMGMENALMSMAAYPAEMSALLDGICDYFLELVDIALEYDIDGVYFGDDWGQQRGLIMGPAHWRRYIKPRMAKLYERVKSKGKYVIQHSCGDCHEIFPDLIEIGLDCYQTFQPEIYDIAEMKRLYGNDLAFWGGISVQQALPNMTPEKVRREVARVAEILRPGGGFILAPSHALTYDIPPENILAMLEVMRNQEKYLK